MTISELYSIERPPPIPLAEHEQRRKKRDIQEIVEAASRRGKKEQAVRDKLQQLESLLPDIINLHKLKASDWVTVLDDVDEVATKLVALKTVFPRANVFKVVSRLPRILLKATVQVQNDAEQSRSMLSSLPDPDSIIETVPDLVDPLALSRALATLKATLPGQNPLQVLMQSPELILHLGGEVDMDDSSEYGAEYSEVMDNVMLPIDRYGRSILDYASKE
ncbi:hypothetical protein CEUSTIGMA_g941.t1 [Chlamydomonas eustigma]|uniref:Uncharacterized protein n=1 Tax=Chlamydomonas eustigma TaxID=1157962 RepID=A0A250WS21_9CHLO|nr:hypothetical protein CEUSTIGMA_g941.t1 [Chlamydomonas eustigma]|eukprot:GAX73489.1 hypothetical protein CEUSTIGMA_g941.t1 [Chlamydomonas eustigma]